MIISRTPLRVSLVGGGTDLEAFYRDEPGAVVSTAIRKYIYITVNPKFDSHIRASYSITEIVDSVDEIRHELIRESLKLLGIGGGVEITSISDIPSQGTGLGSSSSYTVGLLNALYAYRHQLVGAERLAREACDIEIRRCGKPIGKQDQYIAAYGGLQYIQFNPDGSVFVDPIVCEAATRSTLESSLLLLYTGLTRSADPILAEQRDNLRGGHGRDGMRRMARLATELKTALVANDLQACGDVLHESWMVKRSMASGVSTAQIDEWYERARANGALGGKISGAGGGGFLMLFAPRHAHAAICRALPELRPVPILLEPQGSKIIYVEESARDELTDTVRDAFARGYLDEVSSNVAKLPLAQIALFAETVERAYRDDRQVFVIGNGGSASTASHMACDLAKNIYPADGAAAVRRFRVLSLTDNVALITAVANDSGYDRVFAEQLSYYARPADLVIAISASGNSPNVLAGLDAARAAGARTAALLGFDGGRARELADVSVVVDSRNYGHVEDAHLVVNHLVTAWMRRVVAELHRD